MEDSARIPHRLLAYADCQRAIDGLFQHALAAGKNRAFLDFLDFAKRFSNLSVYNAMLVRVQHPGATAVATARRWAGIDRYPKPGARPLMILQPFGPVTFVYAMEDTEGCEISGADASSLFAAGTIKPATYERFVAAAADHGVRVTEQAMGQNLAGFAQQGHAIWAARVIQPKQAHRWEVVINSNLDGPSRMTTLAHELGHVYCGHLGEHPGGRWRARCDLPDEVRELEAEAAAWLVATRNNVSPRSAEYLGSFVKKANLERVSMFAIYDAANRIEARSSTTRRSAVPRTASRSTAGHGAPEKPFKLEREPVSVGA